MADVKEDLLGTITPILTDYVRFVDDPTGTPLSKNALASALLTLFEANFRAASTTQSGVSEHLTTAEIDTGTDTTRVMRIDQYVASTRNVRYLIIPAVAYTTDWPVDGTVKVSNSIPCPFTGTMISIKADVETAGVTGTAIVDVNKNGTTIMATNKLKWDSTEVSTSTYSGTAAALSVTAITAGDLISVDIDVNHSGTKAKGLVITIGIRVT